jgi:hypothetical protein
MLAIQAKRQKEEKEAVEKCRRSDRLPLFKLLSERLPAFFAWIICENLDRGEPVKKATKYMQVGSLVAMTLLKHPGRKKYICHKVAEHFGTSARTGEKLSVNTVEKYYEKWRKATKSVRQEVTEGLRIINRPTP